jgi:rhamnose transport system substrate-binding protein
MSEYSIQGDGTLNMKVRRTLVALPVILTLGLVLPAATQVAQARTAAKSYKVAFLPKNIGNPYFSIAFSGGKGAAKKDGDSVKQFGPATADPSAQASYISTIVQEGYNAICISADDPNVPVPALKNAMSQGVKVVSFDSDVASDGRNIFVNQASTGQIGRIEVQILGKEIKYKGQIAILSAAPTATNQNAWIGFMKKELKKAKYKKMHLVTTVYGNDDPATSTNVAQGLLSKYPKLRGIISPTTVGIVAASQVVDNAGKKGKVIVTGLGTPLSMKKYVLNGTAPKFALWNPSDLGYLCEYTAHDLLNGSLKAKVGASYTAGKLGKYKVGKNDVVVLGKPTVFDKSNINKFNF